MHVYIYDKLLWEWPKLIIQVCNNKKYRYQIYQKIKQIDI